MEVPELHHDGQWVQGVRVVMWSQEQGIVGALGSPRYGAMSKSAGSPREQGTVMNKVPRRILGQEGTCATGTPGTEPLWPGGLASPGDWGHEGERACKHPGTCQGVRMVIATVSEGSPESGGLGWAGDDAPTY